MPPGLRECFCETRYSFHRLPTDEDEEPRRMWLKNLKLKRPPKTLYVCSFHSVDKKPTEEHPHPTLWLRYDRPSEKRRRVLKSSVTRTTDKQDEMDQGEELCAELKSSCDAQTQWSDPGMEDLKCMCFTLFSSTFYNVPAFHFLCTSVHDVPVFPCLTAFST